MHLFSRGSASQMSRLSLGPLLRSTGSNQGMCRAAFLSRVPGEKRLQAYTGCRQFFVTEWGPFPSWLWAGAVHIPSHTLGSHLHQGQVMFSLASKLTSVLYLSYSSWRKFSDFQGSCDEIGKLGIVSLRSAVLMRAARSRWLWHSLLTVPGDYSVDIWRGEGERGMAVCLPHVFP